MIRFYLSGDPVHDACILAMHTGCELKDKVITTLDDYEPSDVAVVFGVYKSKVPASFRRGEVIRQQRQKNLDVLVLETGYINRGDGPNHHYAAGWNGLNGRADFKNKNSPPDRFQKLCVEVKPWRTNGEHVVLCAQVPWDASVDHSDHIEWIRYAVRKIQGNTDREVRFRPHPLAKLPPIPGCDYSTEPLESDLQNAWAVVTFNSNSAVESLIHGVPAFAFDEGSMAWGIANKGWGMLESPKTPNRSQWLNDLAYCQWTLDEMREGIAWRHLSR